MVARKAVSYKLKPEIATRLGNRGSGRLNELCNVRAKFRAGSTIRDCRFTSQLKEQYYEEMMTALKSQPVNWKSEKRWRFIGFIKIETMKAY